MMSKYDRFNFAGRVYEAQGKIETIQMKTRLAILKSCEKITSRKEMLSQKNA